MRYAEMWSKYRDWWDKMTIRSDRIGEFDEEARRLIKYKDRYLEVEKATTGMNGRLGVKWYHCAVIHMREADANFSCYLGNGQSLSRRTTEVPEGRGPFNGPNPFLEGCLDALKIDGLTSVLDWRLEKILYFCELFNGVGYFLRGLPSPYIWGGSSVQRRGKFVSDHRFSPATLDPQPGCAPLLYMMAKLDTSIVFERES